MIDKLDQIYRKKIMEEAKSPYNFHELEDRNLQILAYNPICGDKFSLDLRVENGIIVQASFHGFGCTLSKASTSVLIREMEGRKIGDLQELSQKFLTGFENASFEESSWKMFENKGSFRGREDCIILAWKAIADDIKDK